MWCKIDDTVCFVTELAFPGVALDDVQNDSIESLNLGKNLFNSKILAMIQYYMGGGSLGTPKRDYVIYVPPLTD